MDCFDPEGRLKIAQRFIAGSTGDPTPVRPSRQGRLNFPNLQASLQDARTRGLGPRLPSNKLLGYFQTSLRDGRVNQPYFPLENKRVRNRVLGP